MKNGTATLGICNNAVDAGSHIVCLFNGSTEIVDAAVRFARKGVEEGDFTVIALPHPTFGEVVRRLPERFRTSNRLRLLHSDEVYTREGRFSAAKAYQSWRNLAAVVESPSQLRGFGALPDEIVRDRVSLLKVIEYECSLNRELGIRAAVCGYDVSCVPKDLLDHILATHPFVCRDGTVAGSPSFRPPDVFFDSFYARDKYHFSWLARPENCRQARMAVGEIAARMPFDLPDIEDLTLAVGEAFTNAFRHGSPHGERNIIKVEVKARTDAIKIQVIDEGCGIAHEPSSIDWREPGGKGLYLMRKLCDKVEYSVHGDGCTVKLVKRLTRSRL